MCLCDRDAWFELRGIEIETVGGGDAQSSLVIWVAFSSASGVCGETRERPHVKQGVKESRRACGRLEDRSVRNIVSLDKYQRLCCSYVPARLGPAAPALTAGGPHKRALAPRVAALESPSE